MQSITLELRPRLQTCNAFIRLREKIESTQVQIKLLEESIVLTVGDKVMQFLTKFVKLIPASLSALNIVNDWICFRVQTKSRSIFGSFKTEVVKSTPSSAFARDTSTDNESLKASDCTMLCACCKNVISKSVFFKRVLPLPDGDYDASEWFCCAHSHTDVSTSMSPRESDLFYGPFFFVAHTNIFAKDLKIEAKSIVCNRCLQCLGTLHENDSYKIWSCCVDFQSSNRDLKIATDPLVDFSAAIKSCATGVFGEEIIFRSITKNETHRLIVKPMDWQLNLMVEPREADDDDVISLQNVSVVKVLYKYQTSETTSNDESTKHCEVGLPVIEAGLKYLLLSTKRFPQAYRVASDYYIGHVRLEERQTEM